MAKPQKLAVVTGGAGFVGSHLCERLIREGYRVISLDNYFTGSPSNHVAGVEYRTGHTKDIALHITETPDILFHLGEYARTEKSFEDIEVVWDHNKLGTFGVLEFWRRVKCKLVYAGSSTKFSDNGAGRDQSPYAWTKATNTELVKNYAEWFGLPYAITYFYNVYGPREMAGAYGTLIRIFSELHKNGQPLTVVSPGTQSRNFTHVEDIVNGLMLVGEKGEGDGYGIGADSAYSVREVAEMFGGEIIMVPERKGNRQSSGVDNARTKALGWAPQRNLQSYIDAFKKTVGSTGARKPRVLVFSTTFHPDAGKAEFALSDLMDAMQEVHFDIVTTYFSEKGMAFAYAQPNVTVYRVGWGTSFDKFLLPFLGARIARRLIRTQQYDFMWSLFASYGALGALLTRGTTKLPLLITIADQRLANIPMHIRLLLRHILGSADQVYADDTEETRAALSLARRATLIRSIGDGDAFANQLRFAYSSFLRTRTTSHEA